MTGNARVLELWKDAISDELRESAGASIGFKVAQDTPTGIGAYRSKLIIEGSVRGILYVTASASSLVQFAQMSAGEAIDAHAPWTGEALETWRGLLNAAAERMAARLTEESPLPTEGRCVVLLEETAAVDEMHLSPGPDTSASAAAVQQWWIQAGTIEMFLVATVQVDDFAESSQVIVAEASASEMDARSENGDGTPIDGEQSTSSGHGDAEAKDSTPNDCEESRAGTVPEGNFVRDWTTESSVMGADGPHEIKQPKQRLDLLLDIELEATLRFGALELPLREVLELGPGDVLPLDRHVREPVDLVVGDRIVARGEVVLIDGNFGLHVTEVAEPRSRLETIRCLF